MSSSVPIPDHLSSLNEIQRHRINSPNAMVANLNDISSNFNPLNDDSQSHSGSLSHYAPEELAARVRELEMRVFGSQPPPSRSFSKQNSIPNELSHGGRPNVLGLIQRHPPEVNDMAVDEADKDWKLNVKRWKRVPNRYGSADLYDASQKIEDIRRKEQVSNVF